MTGTINVALIGSKFMGRAHSNAWLNVSQVLRRRSAAGDAHRRRSQRRRARRRSPNAGDGSIATTDWRAAITDAEIGLVDIGTPNNVHAEQSIAALEAGKHVACEKPLAGTLADAEAMAAAAAGAAGTDVRLVQLPPRPGRRARPPTGRRRARSADLPRSRRATCRAGAARHAAALAVPGRHRRLGRARRPQRPHHRHGPLRHRRGDRVGRGRDRADVHQGARRARRRTPVARSPDRGGHRAARSAPAPSTMR